MQVGHHRLKTLTFFRKLLREKERRECIRVDKEERKEDGRKEEQGQVRLNK